MSKLQAEKSLRLQQLFSLMNFFKKKDKTKLWLSTQSRNSSNKEKKNLEKEGKKQCELIRVILIDELDALMTKKQTLLYNLFDWPCH
jgi:origin recognition complex subunit 1